MGNSLGNEKKVEEIPSKGFNLVGLVNIYNSTSDGILWYQERQKENAGNDGNRIFQVKLEDWRIIVADADAVKFVFDDNLVERFHGFGHVSLNRNILNQYTPSEFANGKEHEIKKNFLLEFLKPSRDRNIVTIVQSVFEKLQPITDKTQGGEFETFLAGIASDVVYQTLHGQTFPDLDLLTKWSNRALKLVYTPGFIGRGGDLDLYTEIKNAHMNLSSFKLAQRLARKYEFTDEELGGAIVWMTVFNAYNGERPVVASMFASYARLSQKDKALIKEEAINWFQGEQTLENLSQLKYIDAFVMEALRLFPPGGIAVKAKKDFVLEAQNHNYQIYKDNTITAMVPLINRDPKYFEDPEVFDIHRAYSEDNGKLKRTIVTFAGYFDEISHSGNHKCPNTPTTVPQLKLILLHLTQCEFKVISDLSFTGKTYNVRRIGVEEELAVKSFKYVKPH